MATFAARSTPKATTRKRSESAVPPTMEIQVPRDEIAKRAYEKFVARGCVDGFDQQDWFDAEDELRAEYREQQ